MIITPFSPLFFNTAHSTSGQDCPFTQFFADSDTILLQVIRTPEEPCLICEICSIDNVQLIEAESFILDNGNYVDCYEVCNLAIGCYYIVLGDRTSEIFEIISDSRILEKSVLIEYSPANNSIRTDVVPVLNGVRKYFAFRVPGGFRDSDWDFTVDSEQFTTQDADIVQLYATESTQKSLTVGWGQGVPVWFGQLINRLLTCKYVYIDGHRYARYESSVPEKEQTLTGVNSFVFTQKLQEINHLEPHKP